MAARRRTSRDQYKGKSGEAAGRQRGYDDKGGEPGADMLEDGQLRGVNEEEQIVTGMHGGPRPSRRTGGRPSNVAKRSRVPAR